MAQPFVLDVNLRIQNILGLDKVKAALAKTGGAVGVGGGKGGAKSGGIPGGAMVMPDGAGQKAAASFDKVAVSADKAAKATKRVGVSAKATGTQLKAAGGAAKGFGDSMKLAGVRYAAFVVATAVPFAIIAGFKKAAESVIEFDDALIKISQVMDTTKASLAGLGQSMIRLSTETGTSLDQIAKAAKVLTQAGFRENIEEMLAPLAKIPLLASFESIEQATEGVIATMNQFGADAGDATDILDRFDHVSNKFAITASDLVEGVKRGGGAFAALGGNIHEFIALMTTMRSVTRESAQTIGTSIRTITARMARPRTIKFLEGLGVVVRDGNGELLSMITILSNLNEVFERSGKEGKAAIAETLGGFRQISRVLAAIQNPEKIQEALKASQNASGSIARNAEKGLGSVSSQLNILGAKWIEFVQSMAEPVFIPLIQSATGFLTVVIEVISALGPIIPLFTTLVGFAAGIAALSKSMTLLAGAGAMVTRAFAAAGAMGAGMVGGITSGIGGLSGIVAGRSASQLRQNKAMANLGIGGAGAAAGGGAAAATFGKVPQLLVATGIYAAFKSLSESALESGNSFGFISAEIIKTAAAFALAASLLSGKSIGALGKGAAGYVGGGLATGGAAGLGKAALGIGGLGAGLLVAGSIAAAKQANINIDELVRKAAEHINDLEIEATDASSLKEVGGEIGKTLLDSVQEAAKEFEGLGGYFAAFGERMGAFLSSVGSLAGLSEADLSTALGGSIIDEDKVKEMFTAMYEKSPETFRSMMDAAIQESGPNFREALVDSFASQLPKGTDPQVSQLLRNWLIELTGGEKQALKKVAQEQSLAGQKAFAAETARITKELRDVIIPSQLASQMNMFGSAMDAVTREVDIATGSFREMAGQVGQVGAPQIPTDVSLEAIKEGLGKFGFEDLMGDFDSTLFQELGEAGQVYQQAGQMMQRLLKDLTATEAGAATQGTTLGQDGRIDFSDIKQKASASIEDSLEIFFNKFDGKFPDKYKDAVRRVMESTASSWSGAIQDGMQPDTKQLQSRLDEIMKAVQVPTEGLAEGLQQGINVVMSQIQSQIDYEAKRIELDIGGFQTAEKAFGDFNYAMELIGEGSVVWQGDMERTSASFVNYGDKIVSLGNEIDALEQQRTTAFRELGAAVQQGSPDVTKLAANFAMLNNRMNELQGFGVTQALKMVDESRQALQALAQEDIKDIQERGRGSGRDSRSTERLVEKRNQELATNLGELDQITQHLTSTMKVSQLDAVASSAQIYKSASGLFKKAVSDFQKAVTDLSRPMTADNTPDVVGRPGDVVTPDGIKRPERERTAAQEEAIEVQALGQPMEAAAAALKDNLEEQRTIGQELRDIGVGFANLIPYKATEAVSGKDAADELLREDLAQLTQYSKQQLEAAAAAYAEQTVANKKGSGTGADLNSIENLAANAMKVLEQGVSISRDAFQQSQLSQQRLDNLLKATEDTSRTMDEQTPVTPADISIASDELKKALEAGERYKREQGIDSILDDVVAEPKPDQVSTADGFGGFPPPYTAMGQAIAASLIGALPVDQMTGEEAVGSEQRDAAFSMLEAAKSTAASNEGTLMANETFRLGTDNFRMNVESMTASMDVFRGVADTMQAVVDLQSQVQLNPSESRVGEGESGEGLQQVSTAIDSLGERVDAVAHAVEIQTQQEAEMASAEKEQPLEVVGLEDNTKAIAANSEISGKSQEAMTGLGTDITKIAGAMGDGIGIDIETMSEVKVDVQGVADAAKEFTSEFEAVATRVAKAEIRIVLQQLAAASGNSEMADTFESVV